MKKLFARAFILATTLLLFLASVASAATCIWSSYQPEVPQSLRK
ncbi:MAG: cyclic lactone autoinducer peptide [Peptococcaceae bacterium]|nr:cyclic lactone autoinducer peptide [Candidatus Syntrophopropionicum ammoniitolerans]